MTADRIADALDLLARAVETHDGAPADTNLARAQVLATIAVAEQLAELTQAITRVYPPAPAPGTGGQAEQPAAPRVMLGDVWGDGDGDEWKVVEQDGRPLLLTWDGETRTWESADDLYGPLALVERAGYRPTGGTVPAERLTIGMVVSHPDWVGGAPVRLTAPADGTERAYELFGDGETGVGTAAPAALFTVWEPAGGAR